LLRGTSALPYYKKYIQKFSESETCEFLKLFNDPEFNTFLDRPKCDKRTRQLAAVLKTKYPNVHIQRLLDLIIACPERKLDIIAQTADYKRGIQNLPVLQ
jgi:hypothetical protein